MYKLWEIWLWTGLQRHVRPPHASIIGFRAGHQPLDITYVLTAGMQKAAEWHLPLAVTSLDVRAAFDEVTAEPAAGALLHQGAPILYAANVFNDMVGNTGGHRRANVGPL